MIVGLMAAALLAGGQPAPRNCADPQNQAEMNLCASADFERADDELNAVWRQAVDAIRRSDSELGPVADARPSGETRLSEAQRAWIVFRDAHCAVVGYEARGGSMESMLFNGCRARVTRARIEQLRADLPL